MCVCVKDKRIEIEEDRERRNSNLEYMRKYEERLEEKWNKEKVSCVCVCV